MLEKSTGEVLEFYNIVEKCDIKRMRKLLQKEVFLILLCIRGSSMVKMFQVSRAKF